MKTSVGTCQQIVRQLAEKVPFEQVARKYSWASLSTKDKDCLWTEAERRIRTDASARSLLSTIYRMITAAKEYHEDQLRALALSIRLPSSVVPPARKQDTLRVMREVLERLRDTWTGTDTAGLQRFQQYRADYHMLRAHVQLELGDTSHAIRSYQEALTICEQDGLDERAAPIREEIAILQALEDRGQHLLPLDELKSEKLRIHEELVGVIANLETQQERLSNVERSCSEAKQAQDRLVQEIDGKRARLQELDQECSKQQAIVQELVNDVERHQAALRFLMTVRRAVMAPLWVEVVRRALDRGEIDEFTRQALERLAVDLPKEAVPLLTEIAARSPELFETDAQGFQTKMTQGLTLMARARHLEMQQDILGAAETMVEAWDKLLYAGES